MTIVIVGAGPAGLAMAMRLKAAGYTDFTIVERSSGVGGTWHDNRYPGAGCDVPSHLYCFSFAPKPDWNHKFARQPEIEAYLKSCVEQFGLGPHLMLDTEVRGATYTGGRWQIDTSRGPLAADVLISGTGQLNRPRIPAFPGLASFTGTTFHSARWNHDFDLRGKRVVVIGNGASAAQFVPEIVDQVGHLTLLQRSPGHVFPRKDRAYRGFEKWLFRYVPGWRRFYRAWIYWLLESRFPALYQHSLMGRLVGWMMRRHLHKQVKDPALRAKLMPDYPVGCKRIVISDDFYPALQKPNVDLVTTPIERITVDGVRTTDGTTHAADAIIFATGFDTTTFLAPMRIVGASGVELAQAWASGAEAHRGVLVSGFPNLFILYGPNTNLGHSSILFMLECQVRYVLGCLAELQKRGAHQIEVKPDAMARSNAELQAALAKMTWAADCHNWYKTDGGKITNNWSGRTTAYWWATRKPDFGELEIT